MTRDRSYSAANRCLSRIKTANMDQMLKIQLECSIIKLKRCILAGPFHLPAEEITELEELSEGVVRSGQKSGAIAALEKKINQLLMSAEGTSQQP